MVEGLGISPKLGRPGRPGLELWLIALLCRQAVLCNSGQVWGVSEMDSSVAMLRKQKQRQPVGVRS